MSRHLSDAAGNILEGGPVQWEFTTEGALPGAPGGLRATALKKAVVLDWTAPADMGSGAFLGYRVYRATVTDGAEGEQVLLTRVLGLTYTDAAVEWNTTYLFRVAAMTELGEGPARAAAPVTPVQDVVPPDTDTNPPAPVERIDPHVGGPSTAWAVISVLLAIGIASACVLLSRKRGIVR